MKRIRSILLSLVLVLSLLEPLAPSAGAEGEDNSNLPTSSMANDILVTPSPRDGHLDFGAAGDVESISTRDKKNEVHAISPAVSLVDAIGQVSEALFEANEITDGHLEYLSYITVPGSRGALYDGYNSEGDTGAGVAGVQKYYYGSSDSNYKLENIRFVPSTAFNGEALVNYYGYYSYKDDEGTVRQGSYAGRIYITVAKQVPGISYSTDGEAVRFAANDFAAYSIAVTGRTFDYISFKLPDRSEGTLYYNYIDEDIYDFPVTAAGRYYRNTGPYADRVYFVPNPDYSGDLILNFSGLDISGGALSGQVIVKVSARGPSHTPRADGPFVYSVKSGRSVRLNTADFESQSLIELGDSFASFSLASLPSSSSGVLYDDGNASGVDHLVSVGQSYPTPEDIRFAADKDFTGVVSVPIVVTGKEGDSFDSMLRFDVTRGDEGDARLHYTVEPEKRVKLIGSDFADACYDETGYDIDRIHFDSLPASSLGGLYLNGNEPVDANTSTYYNKEQLDALSFLASTDFAGSLAIPFTGYATGHSDEDDRSFTGTITIASTVSDEQRTIGGNAGTLGCSTTGTAVRLDPRGILDAATAALPGTPATIVFNRPDEAAGRLCLDFVSLSRYTEFSPSTTYPVSDISRISFLPKAGFSGATRLPFIVRDAKGNSYGGNLTVTVTPPTRSEYFSDMASATWAVPAVDFFRYYGTVTGATRTSFAPNASMRRADFLLLLTRAFSLPEAGTASFADVQEDKYYAAAVASAKAAGIVAGSAGGNFNPEGAITREDAMLYLYRALRQAGSVEPGTAADLAAFRDSASVSAGAVEAMGALVRLGVIQGDNGRLRPERILNRAETIVILYRAFT